MKRIFSFELNSKGTLDLKAAVDYEKPEEKMILIGEITYDEATEMFEDLKHQLMR